MSIIRILSLVLVFSSLYLIRFTSSSTLSSISSYSSSQSQEGIEEAETDASCNPAKRSISTSTVPSIRLRRAPATPKHGVVVCITSKDSHVNLGGSTGSHGHSHDHHDEEDENNSEDQDDYKANTPEDDDDDDDSGTVEETDDTNHDHHDIINTQNSHHQHHVTNSKPPRGKGKHKGKEGFRLILEERFSYRNWSSEWVHAKNPENSTTKIYNKFARVYARKSNHSRPDYGIITHNKGGEFYLIATTFPPFSTRNESLVLQFSVQFQSKAHCQLAFLRLYDCQFSDDDLTIQTPYIMQVGPHVCGTSSTNRVAAEFQEPGKTSIKPVDRYLEPVNNTSVNTYALALEPDGSYHVIVNNNFVQNGTLRDEFQTYKAYTGVCAAGLIVWHSVLDKYFKGQIVIDDILVVNDMEYAAKRRNQILNLYSE